MYRNNSTDNKPYIVQSSDNSSVSSIENINDNKNVYMETKKNTEFNDLSYEDVQINLRLLGDLKEGEKPGIDPAIRSAPREKMTALEENEQSLRTSCLIRVFITPGPTAN